MKYKAQKHEPLFFIPIHLRRSAFFLWLFSLILALISLLGQSLKLWTHFDNAFGLVPLFNISARQSVQSIISVLLLFNLMFFLIVMSRIKDTEMDRFRRQWASLPFFALYLALHKGTGVHNLIIDPLVDQLVILFPQIHITRFYVTVTLSAIIFLGFFSRLYFSLPKRTKRLLLAAGFLFIAGLRKLGIDLKMLDGINFLIAETISRWLEMSGTVLLLYAFVDYLRISQITVIFRVDGATQKHSTDSGDKLKSKAAQDITLLPRRVVKILTSISLSLWLVSLAAQFLRYSAGHENALGLIPIMDVGRESSIPTMFSVQLLYLAATVLGCISVFKHEAKDSFRREWTLLSFGFLFMSLDEGSSIHELLTMPVWNRLGAGASGFFRFAWVIPAGALVALIGLLLLKFLITLDKRTRNLFVLSGLIFLSGSIGMEMIGGNYALTQGLWNLPYSLLAAAEELLEMAGATLFVYALLDFLRRYYPEFSLKFE